MPKSWATTPSVPWPGGKNAQLGVRYHEDNIGKPRTYWLFDGNHRLAVCICKPRGLCGLRAQDRVHRPGFAKACATREDRREKYIAAKQANGGTLPDWQSHDFHRGQQDYVMRNGKECVTSARGDARKLCDCGECLMSCSSFNQTHAKGCLQNPNPLCGECGLHVAITGGHCTTCAKKLKTTTIAKEARAPEVRALLEKYPVLKHAPDDIDNADVKQPYVQLNVQDEWKPRIVVKIGSSSSARGAVWMRGCIHGIVRETCGECMTLEDMASSRNWCRGCNTILGGKKHREIGLCATCDDGQTKIARTEIRLRGALFDAVGHPPSAIDDTFFGNHRDLCDVNKPRKPDAAWLGPDRVVICETDEHSHTTSNYSPQCDATWATDMTEALVSLYSQQGHDGRALRIFLVRWNPDARDNCRPQIRVEERVQTVGAKVKELLQMSSDALAEYTPATPHVYYYYYHSTAQAWIDRARSSGGIAVQGVVE